MSNVGAQANFGQAWGGTLDVSSPAVMSSGFTVIAEMLTRRFTTPRGGCLSDPNFGLDLTNYVNTALTSAQLSSLAAQCAQEAQKDERVISASFTLSFVLGTITVVGTVNTAAGPFQLVLAVSALTVALLQVSPQ